MNRKKASLWTVNLGLVLLLVTACSAPQPTAPPPTATSAPTATPEPPPTATATSEPPVWDYVALGDTVVTAAGDYGYITYYSAYLEADLGVKVIQHNKGVVTSRSDQLLDRLRNDQALRDEIREAEVVTVYIGMYDLVDVFSTKYLIGACGGDDNMDCIREMYKTLRANYDAIFDELLALCAPGAIIRAATNYCTSIKKYGYDGDMSSFFVTLNEQIIQSAAEHHIPLARVDVAFNGPAGNENAADKGYLLNMHPSKLGAQVIADVHRELGYEPTVP